MSVASIILIAIAYINGQPVETDAGILYPTQEACVAAAHRSADRARLEAPTDVQFVYKCVDISQVPNAVSVFGSQAK